MSLTSEQQELKDLRNQQEFLNQFRLLQEVATRLRAVSFELDATIGYWMDNGLPNQITEESLVEIAGVEPEDIFAFLQSAGKLKQFIETEDLTSIVAKLATKP